MSNISTVQQDTVNTTAALMAQSTAALNAASGSELKKIYEARRKKVAEEMKKRGSGATVFIDSEEKREPAIRYLTGHINDAVLIIFDDAYTLLIPWDEILAKKNAYTDKIIPYTRYKNSAIDAVRSNLNASSHFKNRRVELPPTTAYPEFLKYVDALSGTDVRCHENSLHDFVVKMRTCKDSYEIECTREAARIGDLIVDGIEKKISSGEIKTETDVALFIERECRAHGCERTGFDTLAAGPKRSWGIHCFPNYTDGEWPGNGLNILDFGVVYKGYTSDMTVTIVKGEQSTEMKKIVQLVQKAYDECAAMYKAGVPVREAAAKADSIFAKAKMKMPHGLGHGIGLEIHEYPRVSTKTAPDVVFAPGMIVTCEPGLYSESAGGCRLENDILITEDGNEVITHSRIIQMPTDVRNTLRY